MTVLGSERRFTRSEAPVRLGHDAPTPASVLSVTRVPTRTPSANAPASSPLMATTPEIHSEA
jgi:hypothetical protein